MALRRSIKSWSLEFEVYRSIFVNHFFLYELLVAKVILLQLEKLVIVLEIVAQMLNSVMMVLVIAMLEVSLNITYQILCIVFFFFFS